MAASPFASDALPITWSPTYRSEWNETPQAYLWAADDDPDPGHPTKHYGIGAVNYHTGQTVVLVRRRLCRREVAEQLQALLDKHLPGTIYVVWDNANTHEDDEVEAVVRALFTRRWLGVRDPTSHDFDRIAVRVHDPRGTQ